MVVPVQRSRQQVLWLRAVRNLFFLHYIFFVDALHWYSFFFFVFYRAGFVSEVAEDAVSFFCRVYLKASVAVVIFDFDVGWFWYLLYAIAFWAFDFAVQNFFYHKGGVRNESIKNLR